MSTLLRRNTLIAMLFIGVPHFVAAQTEPAPVQLKASDGISVFGSLYKASNPRATIVAFHQARSNRTEYKSIAPRLVDSGFNVLAIDQRVGGGMLGGSNETAEALNGREFGYLDVMPDLRAALDWAVRQGLPVVVWGSSYTSALVFILASENPGKIAALLSFSPAEYLGTPELVRNAAAQVAIPLYITSSMSSAEIEAAKAIFDAAPSMSKTLFVPKLGGVHGSSTLNEARNPKGGLENWQAVLEFLSAIKF